MNKKLIWLLSSRLGITTLLVSGYLKYKADMHIPQIIDNIRYRNVPMQQGFFCDPNGLYIDSIVNSNGCREAYLVHERSNLRIPITEGLMLNMQSLLEQFGERIGECNSAEARQYLRKMNDLENRLLDRL